MSRGRYVVADTSVLIFAHRLRSIHLLRELHGGLIVPDAVREEIEVGGQRGAPAPDLGSIPWIEVRQVVPELPEVGRLGLDRGESAVLSLAISLQPAPVSILTDDRDARRAATLLGVDQTGMLGVLIQAKEAGLIAQVRPYFDELRAIGFWVSPRTLQHALALAGEQKRSDD